MYRLRARRTAGANPPTLLLPGELAYSDSNKRLYVGRYDGSIATFESDLSLSPLIDSLAAISTQIDGLEANNTNQANDIGQIASDLTILELTTNDQAATLMALAAQIAAIDTIASNQGSILSLLATETQTALETKLDAAAISDFETSSQLNNRDTANRARVNHTGTQSADTITGLATVATSGAYGDLTGVPPIQAGFTYDQQTEPSNPAAGATWRERNSGGLITGEWQWDNEALRWIEIFTRSQTFNASGTGSNFGAFAVQSGILDPLGTILYLGFRGNFWINTTANASNYYEQRIMTYQKEPLTDSVVSGNSFTLLAPYSAAITTPNINVSYAVSTKQLISRPGGLIGFRSWVSPVGSPGSFRSIGAVLFKNVRPV